MRWKIKLRAGAVPALAKVEGRQLKPVPIGEEGTLETLRRAAERIRKRAELETIKLALRALVAASDLIIAVEGRLRERLLKLEVK